MTINDLVARYRGMSKAFRAADATVLSCRLALEQAEQAHGRIRAEANEARRDLLNAIERDDTVNEVASAATPTASDTPSLATNSWRGWLVRFHHDSITMRRHLVTHVTPFGMLQLLDYPGQEFSPDLVVAVTPPPAGTA